MQKRGMASTGKGRDLKAKLSRVFHTMRPKLTWDAGVNVRNQSETIRSFSRFDRFER